MVTGKRGLTRYILWLCWNVECNRTIPRLFAGIQPVRKGVLSSKFVYADRRSPTCISHRERAPIVAESPICQNRSGNGSRSVYSRLPTESSMFIVFCLFYNHRIISFLVSKKHVIATLFLHTLLNCLNSFFMVKLSVGLTLSNCSIVLILTEILTTYMYLTNDLVENSIAPRYYYCPGFCSFYCCIYC